MDEFTDATARSPIGKGRLYGDVLIDVRPFKNEIHLSDIKAASGKGKGSGTKAMKFLTNLADKHNVIISGTAQAYGKADRQVQDTDRLFRWYVKHGFDGKPSSDGGYDIKYNPTRKH
jgi:hypothetical protein